MVSPTEATYSAKRMGPRTDPCGTPEIHGDQPDRCLQSLTNCFQFDRYDSIQSKTAPAMPESHWRRRSSMVWFIVSNAEVILLSSIAVYILSNTCSSAVPVECPARYADWKDIKFPETKT
jgi:hypothetical protein